MASIVQRKGKYCVVYLYTNDEGKRKQKWETYKTYEEAKKRRTEVEYREQIGKLVMPKCVTMEDLVREFIANYGKNKWALSTYESNVGILEHYVNSPDRQDEIERHHAENAGKILSISADNTSSTQVYG